MGRVIEVIYFTNSGYNGAMSTLSADTNRAAEEVQVALLRQASLQRRFSLVRSMSRTVIGLSRRAIRRANPDASDQENLLNFVSLHYGEDLAKEVLSYLEERNK